MADFWRNNTKDQKRGRNLGWLWSFLCVCSAICWKRITKLGKLTGKVEEGTHSWPLHPSCRAGWGTAKLVKCHDAFDFLLNHLNSQLELSHRDLPSRLLSSGLTTWGSGCFGSLYHILWLHFSGYSVCGLGLPWSTFHWFKVETKQNFKFKVVGLTLDLRVAAFVVMSVWGPADLARKGMPFFSGIMISLLFGC